MEDEIIDEETITVHTDGGARGNPGLAASAFVIEKRHELLYKGTKYLGKATNNVAEYQAVIIALKWILENNEKIGGSPITFFLDSELVVKQVCGVYKVKDENLKKLIYEIFLLIKKYPAKIMFKHIPRSSNKVADFLVNQELDQKH